MGQKVNPIGFRTGITLGWNSRWYASKKEFSGLLLEDFKIREYVQKKYAFAGIQKVEIERTRDEVKVVLHASRPGVIIGRKGSQIEQLQDELQNLVGRRINIKIEEIAKAELYARLVAQDISAQLLKRTAFRRAMKRCIESTMQAGAKGIKVQLSGRLGGAEMARCEKQLAGSIPLSTLRAKIDYGFIEAKTPQGIIGIQVWINQGMYEDEIDGLNAQESQAQKKSKRAYKR